MRSGRPSRNTTQAQRGISRPHAQGLLRGPLGVMKNTSSVRVEGVVKALKERAAAVCLGYEVCSPASMTLSNPEFVAPGRLIQQVVECSQVNRVLDQVAAVACIPILSIRRGPVDRTKSLCP